MLIYLYKVSQHLKNKNNKKKVQNQYECGINYN